MLYRPAGGLKLLATANPAGVASVDFTGLSARFEDYEIRFSMLRPAASNALWLRLSSDGGATFRATAGDYTWASSFNGVLNATPSGAAQSDTRIAVVSQAIPTANGGASGVIRLHKPWQAGAETQHITAQAAFSNGGVWEVVTGASFTAPVAGIGYDAVRLMFASGNIAAGVVRLYGYEK